MITGLKLNSLFEMEECLSGLNPMILDVTSY